MENTSLTLFKRLILRAVFEENPEGGKQVATTLERVKCYYPWHGNVDKALEYRRFNSTSVNFLIFGLYPNQAKSEALHLHSEFSNK